MKRHGAGINPSPTKASRMFLLTQTFTTYVIICCMASFLEAEMNILPTLMANITPGSQEMREQLSLLERCQGVLCQLGTGTW